METDICPKCKNKLIADIQLKIIDTSGEDFFKIKRVAVYCKECELYGTLN